MKISKLLYPDPYLSEKYGFRPVTVNINKVLQVPYEGILIAREFEDSSFVSYLQKDKDVEPKKSIAWQMVHDKKARLGRQPGFSSQASFCTPQGDEVPMAYTGYFMPVKTRTA